MTSYEFKKGLYEMKNAEISKAIYLTDEVAISESGNVVVGNFKGRPHIESEFVSLDIVLSESKAVQAISFTKNLLLLVAKYQEQNSFLPQEQFSAIETKENDVQLLKVIKGIIRENNNELSNIVLPVAEISTFLKDEIKRNGMVGVKTVMVKTQNGIKSGSIEPFESDYYISNEFALAFQMAKHTIDSGKHINIFMAGPSGYGKTSFFDAIANEANADILHWNCATMRDPEKWFGKTQLRNGETFFEKSEFTNALERGNVVILLDEINRVAPEITGSLFSILDYRRETIVDNYKIKCGPGIVFGMTANIGFQYTGTAILDTALKNRNLISLNVKRLPIDIEKRIVKTAYPKIADDVIHFVVDVCDAIRDVVEEIIEKDDFVDIDVSTRTAKNMAEMAQILQDADLPLDKSSILNYAIFNNVEDRISTMIVDKLRVNGMVSND